MSAVKPSTQPKSTAPRSTPPAAGGQPGVAVPKCHPTDSSRLLRMLLTIAADATVGRHEDDELAGAIGPHMLRALLCALNYRDRRTIRHSRRVARLATGVASALGWDEAQLKRLEVACLLHDIGKIGVPDSILMKPGSLTTEEAELMSVHEGVGHAILQAAGVHEEVRDAIVEGRHRFDEAKVDRPGRQSAAPRLLAVADAYDSLRTNQPYRDAKSHNEIMRVLREASGTQFDGTIVAALGRWIEREGPGAFDPTLEGGADTERRPEPGPLDPGMLCHLFSHLYVVESLYDGFALLDADLKHIVWNEHLRTLTGVGGGAVLGQTRTTGTISLRGVDGRPLADDESPLQRVLKTGRGLSENYELRRADGEYLPTEIQAIPLFDDDDTLIGVVELYRDLARAIRQPGEVKELKLAASRDPLTKVANRGELETRLDAAVAKASRNQSGPLSLIFLDIDFFKSVNDNYGHSVGDEVLVETAKLLQQECYNGELVSRFGGEEFVILCPETDADAAVRRAERLRQEIRQASLSTTVPLKVTSSFGVAEYEAGDSAKSLTKRADTALYQSKTNGRDRTTLLSTRDEMEQDEADGQP
ncbi:MAG: diguanylate cyclase, partial [Planctomycetota bacterium]